MTITIKTKSIEGPETWYTINDKGFATTSYKVLEGIEYTFTASSVSKLNSEWKSKKKSLGLDVFDEFYVVYSGNLVLICPGYTQGPDKRLPGSAGGVYYGAGSKRSFKMHIESSEFPYSVINDDYLVVLSKTPYTPKITSTDGFYFAKVEGVYDSFCDTYVYSQLAHDGKYHKGNIRTYLFYKLSDIYDNNLITIAKVCNALASYNQLFSFSVIDTNTFCFFWSIQYDSTYIPLLYTSTNKYKNVFTPQYFADSFSYFEKYLNIHGDLIVQKVSLNEKADDVLLEAKVWLAEGKRDFRNLIIKPITSGSGFNTINLSSVDYLPDYRIDYCPEDDMWPKTAGDTTVTIECGTGYYGLKHRYCSKDGLWSKEDKSNCSYDKSSKCPAKEEKFNWPKSWPETVVGERAIVYCSPSYVGYRYRYCQADGTWADYVNGSCKYSDGRKYCPKDGVWPAEFAGNKASFECPSGYSGDMKRMCNNDGTWGTVDSSKCTIITHCPKTTDWPKTQVGLSGQSKCPSGYSGTRTRICREDGTWGAINSSSCQLIPTHCSADGDWIRTEVNKTSELACPDGYSGKKTRFCKEDGTWENINSTSCHVIEQPIPGITHCSADGDWARTEVNKTAELACPDGYSGKKTRFCKADGTWENINSSSCQLIPTHCPANGDWARTEVNKTAELTCPDGYSGKKTRLCKADGTWEAINDSCVEESSSSWWIWILIGGVIIIIIVIIVVIFVFVRKSNSNNINNSSN